MEQKLRLPALAVALTIAGAAAACSSMPGWTPSGPVPAPNGALFGSAPSAPRAFAPATAAASASASEPDEASDATDEPRVVTDLSTLSPVNPLVPFRPQTAPSSNARAGESSSGGNEPVKSSESAGAMRQVGDDRHPGEERFLNNKAARFDRLSVRLMDQLFAVAEELESTDDVARLRVPTDVRSVVIAGTLNKEGKLVKLVLDQPSGQAAMDKMMLKACKQALYINNPPAEAMTSEGDYRVRIEARIENLASTGEQHWLFKTYLGIALL